MRRMISPIYYLFQYFLFHLLCSAVQSFTVSKDGVVGKAAILTGPAHIGVPAACFQRVDPGPCGRDIIRVFYDHKTYTCKAFSYSGCGGNMNRFVSVKNCYKLCHPYYRQRPADIMDAGTTTPGTETTPEPTTTEEPPSTVETRVVVPYIVPRPRPQPQIVFQPQPQPQVIFQPQPQPQVIFQPQQQQQTGFMPMGMMPMTSGTQYSQPWQGYTPYQQGYGKKK